ncbi:MAG: biopolymer transporter ExbD [Bdellovibrionota bacterium]
MTDKDLLEFRRWKDKRMARRRRQHFSDAVNTQELNLVAMMDMMTILLVFLLKSYSVSAISIPVGGELQIPMSSHTINPNEAVKLTITKTGTPDAMIAVDEEAVVRLTPETLGKLQSQTKSRRFLIPELQKALQAKAQKVKNMAQAQAKAGATEKVEFDRKIMVLADKETPYWLITAVLFTSAESEFDQYQLVALRQEQ